MSALIDEWWRAAGERRLVIQRCGSCGHHQHHPRTVCVTCGGDALGFVEAAGTGTVWSHTTVHRAPAPEVAVPYTVALVRLDEGPVLLTHLGYADAHCDDRVRVTWRQDGERLLPVFDRAFDED